MARNRRSAPVFARYGAPMGRHTGPDYLEVDAGQITLQRVPINSGGYDRGGAYWGLGPPLWYAEDQNGNSQFFRARDRGSAKAKIRDKFPGARFFR